MPNVIMDKKGDSDDDDDDGFITKEEEAPFVAETEPKRTDLDEDNDGDHGKILSHKIVIVCVRILKFEYKSVR